MTKNPQPKGSKPPALRYAFVDRGFDEGEIFCKQLLASGEFSPQLLKQFVPRGFKSAMKLEQAAFVAQQVISNADLAHRLVSEFCEESRGWLAVRFGEIGEFPRAKTGQEFLTGFGDDVDLFGPFSDGITGWYVFTKRIRNYIFDETTKTLRAENIRWSVVVEADRENNYVALHWHGFGANENDKKPTTGGSAPTFPYWNHIPGVFDRIGALLSTELEEKPLHEVVFNMLMSKFKDVPGYRWTDRRIRADREGVAVQAHSAAVVELAGLAALTNELGKTAMRTLGFSDPAELQRVQKALLQTMLKEWGPKSYEFALDKEDSVDRKQFHAHCYFGLRPPDFGQDGLQHLNCFKDYLGSRGALRFLLPYFQKL